MYPEIRFFDYTAVVLQIGDIQERVQPVSRDIVDGHLEGWDVWLKLLKERPDFARPFGRSERATFLHPHICRAIDEKVGKRGYHMNRALTFAALGIANDLLVRFKYMRDGRPHNIQTEQQTLLSQQLYNDEMMENLALEGFTEPPTFVTVGYILDQLERQISRVVLLRDCAGYEPHLLELYPRYSVIEPLTFPIIPETRPARVRSKRPAAKEDSGYLP